MPLRITIAVGALALILADPSASLAQEEAIAAARASAKEWLVLLDDREWVQTWEQAAELLQAAVSQDRWARRMSVTLGPLGKVRSRVVRSSEHSTTMPGAPDGEYVVLQYDTTFESKQIALENVVMMKQPNGSWKIAGYRIK